MPRKPKKKGETRRLNLEMSGFVRRNLDRLREKTGAVTLTEVVQNALGVYDSLVSLTADGSKVIIRGENEEKEIVLLPTQKILYERSYNWEQLFHAVRDLASDFPLRERLALAAAYRLMHVKRDALPQYVQERWEALYDKLTSATPEREDDGKIQASIRKLSDAEVVDSVQAIVDIYDAVAREEGPLV